MGKQLASMSEQIDLELFQWSAAQGVANRLDGNAIQTKHQFMNQEAVRQTNRPLLEDMYRAYRTGYDHAFTSIAAQAQESA